MILKVMDMNQSFGMNPGEPLCDRSWSPRKWAEHYENLRTPAKTACEIERNNSNAGYLFLIHELKKECFC
jgi:hypothetical protein